MIQLMNKINKIFLKFTGFACLLQFIFPVVKAEDVIGEVFPIIEEDLSEVISQKLQKLEETGEIKKHQKIIQERVETGIRKPMAVAGIKHTITPRTYSFDPSITVPQDLKDHQGNIFQKAGTKVNPLHYRSFSKSLLFIDGDEAGQLSWAFGHC